MPLPAPLRSLQADLPACRVCCWNCRPLMRDDERALPEIAALIESDMALAAAVVHRQLGDVRPAAAGRDGRRGAALSRHPEVVAISYASALRAAFPPSPRMNALWRTAGLSGLLMGRSAAALGVDPLQAHTAGLFARSGRER